MAEAARVYAKRAQLGEKAVRLATEIKLRAERKAGEILRDTLDAKTGPKQAGSEAEPNPAPTLVEIGVTKKRKQPLPKTRVHPAGRF